MFDAALYYAERAAEKSSVLERLALKPKGYVLATVHRAENTDHPERLRAIFAGLSEVAETLPVVLPLHPRTRRYLAELAIDVSRLQLIEPVGYLDMVMLEKHAWLIATDSGGVQKEAYFYRVPCVTLRDETEWVELIEHGWNRLVPPVSPASISQAILQNLDTQGAEIALYGEGRAAQHIVEVLQKRR